MKNTKFRELGRFIALKREAIGYNQGSLAYRVDITPSMQSKIESGQINIIKEELLMKFAKVLHVPEERLFPLAHKVPMEIKNAILDNQELGDLIFRIVKLPPHRRSELLEEISCKDG